MVARPGALVVALVLLASAAPAPAQQPALTDADTQRIRKEVTAAVDKYYRYFSEQNMKALPEDVFNIPWIVISGNGPQPDLTKEQALSRFEASLKQLVESGWGKSVFTTESVCVLMRMRRSPAATIRATGRMAA
jgi:hypothetical protein